MQPCSPSLSVITVHTPLPATKWRLSGRIMDISENKQGEGTRQSWSKANNATPPNTVLSGFRVNCLTRVECCTVCVRSGPDKDRPNVPLEGVGGCVFDNYIIILLISKLIS